MQSLLHPRSIADTARTLKLAQETFEIDRKSVV